MVSFFVGVILFCIFVGVIGHIIHLASYGDEVYTPPQTLDEQVEEMRDRVEKYERDQEAEKKIKEKQEEQERSMKEQFQDWFDLTINGERVTAVKEEYEIDSISHQAMDVRHYTIEDSDGVVGMIDQPLDVLIPTAQRTGLFRKKIDC